MTSLNFFFVRNYFPDKQITFLQFSSLFKKIISLKIWKSFFTDIFPFFTEFNGLSA
jgi:hypothetical protein